MKADKYHGIKAVFYDRDRQTDGTWIAEHALVEKLVTKGPVLDVPFGTGRYVPIYNAKRLKYLGIDISADMLAEAKKKYPKADCRVGSIFDLPGGYQTAVCTRMLNWFYPEDMARAMGQLCNAAETLVFTARTGTDGDRRKTATYTYSTTTLKQLIGGRLWEQHRVGGLRHGEYIMVKARKPVWADVEAAFKDRNAKTFDLLAAHWAARIGVEKPDLKQGVPLTVEWWSHEKLGDYIDMIAKTDPAMIAKRLPRREDGPLIAFKRDGKYALMDGRHRANVWRHKPGVYPIIVMEC